MAESAGNVNNFLQELAEASMPKAKEEYKELQAYAKTLGADFELMPWDWSYYSEKLRNERYNINDAMTKPYFQLENVEKEVLALATTLYGIEFKQRTDIPVYHKDVKTYEVSDADGDYLGLLYLDFFPRAGKQSGAWMTSFRSQYKDATGDHRPHITIVTNFSKPTENKPSLLTFDEVTTLLHEFGHGLHGMLSDVEYKSQSGTSVVRDFVELPSQIMENFAYQKEWLHKVARHYETGESMPDEIIDRIIEAGKYHAGAASARQLSLGMTDMAWHSITKPFDGNVIKFEQDIMFATAPPPPPPPPPSCRRLMEVLPARLLVTFLPVGMLPGTMDINGQKFLMQMPLQALKKKEYLIRKPLPVFVKKYCHGEAAEKKWNHIKHSKAESQK